MTSENESDRLSAEKKADEAWKEKARQEKEKLAQEGRSQPRPVPPASFAGIIDEYYLRTIMALGQFPNPATGRFHFDLESAKYSIDTLAVLEEKTKGNLQPEEKRALEEVLYRLRMTFVQETRNPPDAQELERRAQELASGGGEQPQPGSVDTGSEDSGPKIIL